MPLTHDSWRAESEEGKNDFGFKTSPNNKIRPNLIMFCFQRVTLPLDLQNLLIVASSYVSFFNGDSFFYYFNSFH